MSKAKCEGSLLPARDMRDALFKSTLFQEPFIPNFFDPIGKEMEEDLSQSELRDPGEDDRVDESQDIIAKFRGR